MTTLYRTHPAPFTIPIAPPVRRVRRLLCWLAGHRWHVRATSDKHVVLCDLHPLAGQLADCTRCGERWDDLPAGWEQQLVRSLWPRAPESEAMSDE